MTTTPPGDRPDAGTDAADETWLFQATCQTCGETARARTRDDARRAICHHQRVGCGGTMYVLEGRDLVAKRGEYV